MFKRETLKYDELLPHKGSHSLSASTQKELECLQECHERFPTGAFCCFLSIPLDQERYWELHTHFVITWTAQQQYTLGLIYTEGGVESMIQFESGLWKWLKG